MSQSETTALVRLIKQFREFSIRQLPVLEQEVSDLINRKETDIHTIELLLGVLLSMLSFGVGEELFNRLQQYYKPLNRWGYITYQALAAELEE